MIKKISELHSFKGWLLTFLLLGLAVVLLPLLNMWLPENSTWHVPDYMFPLLGKYLCYALVALADGLNMGIYWDPKLRAWGILLHRGICHGNVFDEKYWQRRRL